MILSYQAYALCVNIMIMYFIKYNSFMTIEKKYKNLQ